MNKLLQIPRNIAENTFRVIQRALTLMVASPIMLRGCLCFNVPVFTIFIFLSAPPLRRMYGTIGRANELASADTLEILQNVRTVRQFSMEKNEEKKYSDNNLSE